MGRIPDRFIKDLLDRSDIVEVIGSRLELKRAGKEFRARSPFTNEKTPSFFVNPSKQMFFDFWSAHGGVEKGMTPGGIHIRNVAQPVIKHAYHVYCLGGDDGPSCD